MARTQRTANGKPRKRNVRPKLYYFFINGKLHKRLHVNRGSDQLTAWNYPDGKRMVYSYTDVLKRHQKAFTTPQVAKLIGRNPETVARAIWSDSIPEPQFTYGLDENRNKYKYMWREEDIVALHEYLSTVHKGAPRKDGGITPQALPTLREIRAMINEEEILYIKQDDDTFIPSWRAKDI